jgi:hypothetical protein
VAETLISYVPCGKEEGGCECIRPSAHADDYHECSCAGRWQVIAGVFYVVRWPGATS